MRRTVIECDVCEKDISGTQMNLVRAVQITWSLEGELIPDEHQVSAELCSACAGKVAHILGHLANALMNEPETLNALSESV